MKFEKKKKAQIMQKKAEEATKQAHEKYLEKTKSRGRKVSPKKESS